MKRMSACHQSTEKLRILIGKKRFKISVCLIGGKVMSSIRIKSIFLWRTILIFLKGSIIILILVPTIIWKLNAQDSSGSKFQKP